MHLVGYLYEVDPRNTNFGIKGFCVMISATLVPLPAGNNSRYTLTRSLGCLQSRSVSFGEENILCLYQE
jgi:hypothetical protein